MMATIETLSKNLCTGCSACMNACPVHAIEMRQDEEGFTYPVINVNCVNCGLCAATCPAVTRKLHVNDEPDSYAAWADEKHRASGGSGGIFSCLAEKIIEKGGAVYGAAFEAGCRSLHHICVTDDAQLPSIYKSKYVQSSAGSIYSDVKIRLETGVPVLFSGCPCQVDGLKAYLKKDYDNLITVDILCHGVPSPLAYNRFLDEVTNKRAISSVDFRDKKYGWGKLICIRFSNGEVHYDYNDRGFLKAFYLGLTMRQACSSCQYANPSRVGDITLGDFWGVDTYRKGLNDGKGTSLVLCSTDKGRQLFDEIKGSVPVRERIPYNQVVDIARKANAALVRPVKMPEMRRCFFKHLEKGIPFSKSLRYAERALMDIGLVGWWNETARSNYGSTLTNYALYRYLSDEGYSVAFISPPNFDRQYAGAFCQENGYRMTAKYDAEHMSENNKYIDTFIVGSDVLWYYNAMIRTGYLHLLDFVDDDHKKIAYSTSFGNTNSFFPKQEIPKVYELMNRFDHVAVREFEGVDICQNCFDIQATQVLDPVFLTDDHNWASLSDKAERKTRAPFLFAYMLDPTEEKAQQLILLARKKNLKLVSITDKQFNPEEKLKCLQNCGILENASIYEIIYHLRKADFIVTDSYHGFCFSLVFRRNFMVLVNRNRGSSRFETLGKLLGVENRFTDYVSDISWNEALHEPVDYSDLGDLIDKETERCKQWLIDAIESKREPKVVKQFEPEMAIGTEELHHVNMEDRALLRRLIRRLRRN